MDAVLKEPGGRRAVAFVQIGQMEFAEKELIKLYAEKKKLRKQLLAYAESVTEYPDLSVRLSALSGEIETPDGDDALFPYPNWTPTNGWQLDKALVYAFVRQESCFKNKAFSKAGARGVMQLMPSTARLMARRLKQPYQLSRLHRIPYNLMIGQELIKTLLNYKAIDGNLLMTIASYNCGPGNTVKWQKREDFKDDPLMFVEAIPSRETRGFVKRLWAITGSIAACSARIYHQSTTFWRENTRFINLNKRLLPSAAEKYHARLFPRFARADCRPLLFSSAFRRRFPPISPRLIPAYNR